MSLKAVHIIFITCSTLLALGFGAWALNNYFNGAHARVDLIVGILSVLAAVGLVWYGRYFLKKVKNISYL